MKQYRLPIVTCVLAIMLSGVLTATYSQPRPGERRGKGRGNPDAARQRSLAEPFIGITADGTPRRGLFTIKSTGVSTEPLRLAAETFLAALSEDQRKRTLHPVDDIEWRKWDNRHRYERAGVGFDEMSEQQRALAFEMIGAGLSARGLKKTQDIMKLNGTLAELTDRFDEYGRWLYWITIMGEPSATTPWGWQLDGHHVVINYFVLGDQVVMSPVFMGSEPVHAAGGEFKGTIVMQEEQDKGLKLINSLDALQRALAIIEVDKTGNNNLTEAFNDNVVLDYAGVNASTFDADQRALLMQIIAEYIGNMDAGHRRVKMNEIRAHLHETYFAWIGGTSADSVYYYRIHSPVVLIEFDHQRPVALGRSPLPTRAHIHTVVRTPNGNDYGKDLLRQHYELHHGVK